MVKCKLRAGCAVMSRKRPAREEGASGLASDAGAVPDLAKIARTAWRQDVALDVHQINSVVDQYLKIINEMKVSFVVVSKNKNTEIHDHAEKFVREAYQYWQMQEEFEDMWDDVMRQDECKECKLLLIVWKRRVVTTEYVKILGFVYGSVDLQNKFRNEQGVGVHEIKMIFIDYSWRSMKVSTKIYLGSVLLWVYCAMQVRRENNEIRMFGVELPKKPKEDKEDVEEEEDANDDDDDDDDDEEDDEDDDDDDDDDDWKEDHWEEEEEDAFKEEDNKKHKNAKLRALEICHLKRDQVRASQFFKSFGFKEVPDGKMFAHVQDMTAHFWTTVKKIQEQRPCERKLEKIAIENDVKKFVKCTVTPLILKKIFYVKPMNYSFGWKYEDGKFVEEVKEEKAMMTVDDYRKKQVACASIFRNFVFTDLNGNQYTEEWRFDIF